MDFEPEVFAFALAYAEKKSKNQAKPGLLFFRLHQGKERRMELQRLEFAREGITRPRFGP